MHKKNYPLYTEEETDSRTSKSLGSFESCLPSMQFFPPQTANKTGACLIICPGGGYQMKAADYEGSDVAKYFSDRGFACFVLDYRVFPDLHPAPITDIGRAIETARKQAGRLDYDEDKIVVLGFSAGGHLCASAGTMWTEKTRRPDAMVLAYPVISFSKFSHLGSRASLLGSEQDKDIIDDLSCENRVDKQTPPAFIWHTADDETVPVQNSLMFASALASKEVPFELHIFPHGHHGLGLAEESETVSSWPELCVKWLNNLWASEEEKM